ncbi:unnamed protein product [Anisakis simplex]|uniref:Cyclin-dependent kinase inhibitor 1 (inferred by orthology to a C. elegans protein) n=1 Tax=Anisakis simplex TaxID=6269 RepID=A0A0M3KHN7_ANISI|nr:unnamed protein product [Anisakis simplex]
MVNSPRGEAKMVKTRSARVNIVDSAAGGATSEASGSVKVSSARRCLFGKSSRAETDLWLADTLKQLEGNRGGRFNFDFEKERPIAVDSAEYSFEAVREEDVSSIWML